MNRSAARRLGSVSLAIAALAIAAVHPSAQSTPKKALTVEDYTKWKSISDAAISGDGKCVVYVLQTTNVPQDQARPVLHVLNLETNQDVAVANATGGTFSADSNWIAYQIDPSPGRGRGRGARGGAGNTPAPTTPVAPPATPGTPPSPPSDPAVPPGAPAPPAPATRSTASSQNAPADAQQPGRGANAEAPPPPRRVEVRNLASGNVQSFQDIGAFLFSPDSSLIVLKRRPPEGAGSAARGGNAGGAAPAAPASGGRGSAAADRGPVGTDVIVLDLRAKTSQFFGSVADIAFNKKGDLLAYTVDAAIKDGNGLFVYDVRRGRIVPLDNDGKIYNRLAWSEDGTALAVLKGVDVDTKRERDNVLLAYTNVAASLGIETRTTTDADRGAGAPGLGEDGDALGGPSADVVASGLSRTPHLQRAAVAAAAAPAIFDPKKADGFPKD
ncbi:MAG TPA: hypothetical protein VGY57_05115, partial [Vicinamibacterales bacterium]|nr:hypothetical protein [Vicinamibacterales bacterium]